MREHSIHGHHQILNTKIRLIIFFAAKDGEVLQDQITRSVVSDSVWPHRQQPTRLHHPWDSPGKNTGVGCHFWRSSIQSAKTRPGADCGSDHELLIAKFRVKLKKVGESTRPFRYDLNQIPYDYTVEVRNRFKGLDLIDRVPENYGQRFMTLYRKQGSRPSPRKRNAKKQNGCVRRPYK